MKHTFADTLINMMIRLNQVKVERGGLSTSFSLSFAIYCIDGNKLRLINMKDVNKHALFQLKNERGGLSRKMFLAFLEFDKWQC